LASIAKAKELLRYNPQFSQQGLKEAIDWYWNNLIVVGYHGVFIVLRLFKDSGA
jgi:hypothetical protein